MISLVQTVLRARAEEHEARMRNLRPFEAQRPTFQCRYCPTLMQRSSKPGQWRVICHAAECRRTYKREKARELRERKRAA